MLKLHDWVDINKLDFTALSFNPNAIELLKENRDKINCFLLSLNENAMSLLNKNQDKIDWYNFSSNPIIFTYDYIKMKENFKNIRKEINANIFNSKNIEKWNELGFSENEEMLKVRDWLNKNKVNWRCLINSDIMETIEK